MRGDLLIALDKELLQKLEEYIGSSNTNKMSKIIKEMIMDFAESPHELVVSGIRPRKSSLVIRVRLPYDVFDMLKEYARSRNVSMPSVARSIIAERLGVSLVKNDNKEKKPKKVSKRKVLKSDDEELVVVTFKVEKRILNRIDLIAINMRLSRSDVIREAVEEYLKKNTGNGTTRVVTGESEI